jgi:large subunit ribosomal protein L6
MSRIGKLPVKLPEGLSVNIEDNVITVVGPKGSLTQKFSQDISVSNDQNLITVSVKGKGQSHKALHGLYRSLINNMVIGVTTGWSKTLELTGVGYKAQVSGEDLVLNLGYSHPVKFAKPQGIQIAVLEKEGRIVISGADKQLVGETAAKIRRLRPPEPYKGKGIHYLGEKIKRKAGKSTKTAGGVGAK